MKIVFFTSGLSGGGAERVCCNLANFLCQREHDIEFITISDDEATYPLSTKISRQALLHSKIGATYCTTICLVSTEYASSSAKPDATVI